MVKSFTDLADEAYNSTLCAFRVDVGPAETFGISGTVGMSGTMGVSCTNALPISGTVGVSSTNALPVSGTVGVSCTDALPVCADGGSLPTCADGTVGISAGGSLPTCADGTVGISAGGSLPTCADGTLGISTSDTLPISVTGGGSLGISTANTIGISTSDTIPISVTGGGAIGVSASAGLDTGLETFGTIYHGSTSAVAASTAYQLPSQACKSVAVKAGDDNTNEIYIGDSTVTASGGATDGYRLNSGQGISFRFSNVNVIYFAAQTAGDWIHYVALDD